MSSIIFNAHNVRAILNGRKTQTRRIIEPPVPSDVWYISWHGSRDVYLAAGVTQAYPIKPRYRPHQKLWVREPFAINNEQVVYAADYCAADKDEKAFRWQSARFMPNRYSRIQLTLTEVRAERLQNITIDDVLAEGFWSIQDFCSAWGGIHGSKSWPSNPWVWVLEFTWNRHDT